VRAALVAADQQGGVLEWSLEQLRDEFLRRFDKAACSDSLEEEQTQRLGINMLARFQAEQRERTTQLIAADERFEAIFEGLHFAAVADRVERDADGKLVVARYDVTSKPPGPERLKREFSMGLLIAIVAAKLDEIPTGRIYALRPGKVYDVTLEEAELVVVRGRAIMAARLIQADADFQARAGDGCRWCRVRSGCSAWQDRRRSLLDAGGA
jgi:RecB family exonuclease